jgi:hypothetical protein
MAKKQAALPSHDSPTTPAPRSRKEELLDALLEHTTNPTHMRVIKAYMSTGTVAGAEQEFVTIIDEIINEA